MKTNQSKTKTLMKPCELPCPQCGSTDILRRYHAKGSTWSVASIDEHNRYATEHMWTRTATEEHLTHHCRCCQHDWQTLTLRAAMIAELLTNGAPQTRRT